MDSTFTLIVMFLIALFFSLPILWLVNKFMRKVRRDKTLGWIMVIVTIVATFAFGALVNELDYKGSGWFYYLIIYITYWVTVKIRNLSDRYNVVAIGSSITAGVVLVVLLDALVTTPLV